MTMAGGRGDGDAGNCRMDAPSRGTASTPLEQILVSSSRGSGRPGHLTLQEKKGIPILRRNLLIL